MAIQLLKKTVAGTSSAAKPSVPQAQPKAEAPTQQPPWEGEESIPKPPPPAKAVHAPAKAAPAPQQAKPGLSFLKRGAAAQAAFAQEEHKAELRREGKISRFFTKENTSSSITFLDGGIVNGVLDITYYYEHNVNMNGKWGNFYICTQDEEPCPLCEGGLYSSYVGVLSVIDHSAYVSKKDGKTYKDQVRLFVAKLGTIKALTLLAAKRGGLTGWRVDVSRTGDKSPSVGNVFDFLHHQTPEQIAALYGESAKPLDYDKILGEMWMSAKELRKLGFGSGMPPIGSESASPDDYADSL